MNYHDENTLKDNYIPEIDTLRAVAVILVVLFHAYPALMPGGYIGVDIFFVISGFVISRRYLASLISNQETLKSFYAARFRRLAPAVFIVLLLTTISAYFLVLPDAMFIYSHSLIAQPLYLQNFVFWNEGDYFNSAYTKPLLHTWSLAVEEQFYILFGILIVIVARSLKIFLILTAVAFIISIMIGIFLEPISPKTGFFLLPTRVWQFALGIFSYLAVERLGKRDSAWIGGLGGLAVLVCLSMGFLFGENAPFPGPHAYIACSATALALICFDIGRTAPSLLRLPPLLYTGRISYGFYLWHWPPIVLFYLVMARAPGLFEAALLMLLAFAGAVLSYHLIEEPIRRRKALVSPAAMWRFLIGGMAATALAGLVFYVSGGGLFRYQADIRTFFAASEKKGHYRCSKLYRLANPRAEICPLTDKTGDGGVLILGDSHADVLDEMLAEIAEAVDVPLYLTVRNCDLGMYSKSGYCSTDILRNVAQQAKMQKVKHILAISSWPQDQMVGIVLTEQVRSLSDDGFRITVMKTVPMTPDYDPVLRAKDALSGKAPLRYDGITLLDYEAQTAKEEKLFSEVAEVLGEDFNIIRPDAYLCSSGECDFHTDGFPNYFDSNHLNFTGREKLRPLFEKYFAQLN